MVARSGLFVAPVPGAPPIGTSPTDARLALGGLFGTVPQLERGGAITQSASVMQFSVAQAMWQLPDVTNPSATFMSATDPVVLTAAAGPGTGSRLDAIAVKQNNYENGDADSRANVIIIAGTPGAPGVLPTIPAAYWLYASILVPTSAATAAACTVTVFGATTSIAIRNAQFVNPVQGNQFWRNDKGRTETYFGLYNSTTNPGGKTTAGWYQTSGNAEVGIAAAQAGVTIVYSSVLKSNGFVTFELSVTLASINTATRLSTLPVGFRPLSSNGARASGGIILSGDVPTASVLQVLTTGEVYGYSNPGSGVGLSSCVTFKAIDTPVLD